MLTCTACRLEFDSYEAQKEHFRTDWHRYNLKRKVVELPPVTLEQFHLRMEKARVDRQKEIDALPKKKQASQKNKEEQQVKVLTKCIACHKTFTSTNAYQNHLSSKKHLANVKKKITSSTNNTSGRSGIIETIEKKFHALEVVESKLQKEEEEEEMTPLAFEKYKKTLPLSKVDCIFCSHQAKNFDQNVQHMLKEHGFFIPDAEFLIDPEGLVGYLAEKVKVGHFCLQCNGKGKIFRTYQDAQKHMIALSHCKIKYDEDEDLMEIEDYYDFTSQFESTTSAVLNKDTTDEDDVEWETDSEASIDSDEEIHEEENQKDEIEEEKSIEVSDTGELILINGRRLGRREFHRYYKQRFRPEETRDAILAATKERLLLAYQTAGVETNSTSLSTAFVANFMRRHNVSCL
jgi:pre-60S factor REI1